MSAKPDLALRPRALLQSLKTRFESHRGRHPGMAWSDVAERLEGRAGAMDVLGRMESTGGEPDVIGQERGRILFCDCSAESPAGRRSLCFDRDALQARKKDKPVGSVEAVAAAMGIDLLSEEQYRALQQLGEFDLKTSSWIATPGDIRSAGGALFGDRRYGRVFIYHNGAQSYYAARGFRGLLRV